MWMGVVERMTTKTSHHSRHLGGGGVGRDHEIHSENACSESGTSRSCRIRGINVGSSGSDGCHIPVSLAFTCVFPKAYAFLLRQTKQREKGV